MNAERRAGRPGHRRALAVLLGTVLALLLAEGALRVAGPRSYAPREDHYVLLTLDPDPERLHWGFEPGNPSWHAWDGDPYGTLPVGARLVYDDVNAAGLRGPLPPEDDTPRVLFLGDSFTFGEGVAGDRTFAARVEARLRDDGRPVATLNAGVPGYGTFEESLRLPALLDRFQPEAVVVVFTPNDPIHVSAAKARGHDLLRETAPPDPRPLRLLALLDAVVSDRTAETERWYLDHYAGESADAWDRARSLLLEMRDLCRARGMRYGVAYFPLLHRLEDDPLAAVEVAVRQACERGGVPYVDLRPAFAGLDDHELHVHPVDHHPNARAHAAAAARLVPFISDLLAPR